MALTYSRIEDPPRIAFDPSRPENMAAWRRWFEQVPRILDKITAVNADNLDKVSTGVTRHSELQGVEQADDTQSDTTGGKHVTNALVSAYRDHVDDTAHHHTQDEIVAWVVEQVNAAIVSDLIQGNAITLTVDSEAHTVTIALTKAAAQADSTATDTPGLRADHNALLAKLRSAGFMGV